MDPLTGGSLTGTLDGHSQSINEVWVDRRESEHTAAEHTALPVK